MIESIVALHEYIEFPVVVAVLIYFIRQHQKDMVYVKRLLEDCLHNEKSDT